MPISPRRRRRTAADVASLRSRLDALYRDFDQADAIVDPVNLVRRYTTPADREIAGFCAAALAFGRVASVNQSIEMVFALMGPSPAAFTRAFDPGTHGAAFSAFVHRWTRGPDIVALLWVLKQILDRAGSIEAFFAEGDDASAADIGPALDSFGQRALALDLRESYGRVPKRPGVCYFFPRPSTGSACKRLNLFLRWMARRDAVDLGVWTRLSPSRLVVPLDTHVIRLGQCLGLTRYRSAGWRMAADITASLRAIDPVDPVRFDFSICHVGMMGSCGFRTRQGDSQCPLRGFCRPQGSGLKAQRRRT